jgi:hypothetical protein
MSEEDSEGLPTASLAPSSTPVPPPPLPLAYATAALVPYESPAPRARMAIRWTWATVVAELLTLWPIASTLAQRVTMARGGEAGDANMPIVVVQGAIQLAYAIVSVVALVFEMMWVHRTYRNLPALGAQGLRFSPGWAVAYYFIPIISFYRPFQVMRETWRASDPDHPGGTSWQAVSVPPIVNWWWGLSLFMGLVSLISGGLEMNEANPAALAAASSIDVFLVFLGLVVMVLQIAIVKRVTALQEERANSSFSPVVVR